MDIENAAARLRTTIRLIVRRADAVSGGNAPTRSEQEVMIWLDEKGSLTPGALAAAIRVRPQTIGQTLDLLDQHGWIKRSPHPADRRQVLISLSPSGRRALARGRSLRQAWLATELAALNKKELGTILSAIGILERIAQKDSVPSSPQKIS